METLVFVFSGFLESGKTNFINETLRDPNFSTGEKTLLIACEEGMEEYDTKELEKNGKKLAYVGLITTGVKDQMKEIAVVIFGYGTYGDQGYKIYHLFAEQYVKP